MENEDPQSDMEMTAFFAALHFFETVKAIEASPRSLDRSMIEDIAKLGARAAALGRLYERV